MEADELAGLTTVAGLITADDPTELPADEQEQLSSVIQAQRLSY